MQDRKIQFKVARTLITLAALIIAFVPLFSEINVTHLLNPYWPANARFHEAWLIGVVSLSGCLMLYLTWAPKQQKLFCTKLASLIGLVIITAYGAACITSPYYGGSLIYEGQTNPMLLGLMKTLWFFLGTSACLLLGLALTSALSRWEVIPNPLVEESHPT